ncbi:MAG: CoA-binding protein, partial [Flavobacteriaceae bacterium]|nr:CoA-binding protein [Flavobacteriaceae bacterium]
MVKKTLVLGASLKPERYSNIAIRKLNIKRNEVLAIGLRAGKVDNIQIHKKLLSFKNIHTITLYINNKRQKEYYDYIISLKPKRVIFNP